MLACIGDLLADVIIEGRQTADGMPSGIHFRPGGSAANVAVWARRAGAQSCWIGAVGDDLLGTLLLEGLTSDGVPAHATRIHDGESGVVLSRLGTRGGRTMRSARMASALLRPEHLPEPVLKSAGALHLTGYSFASESLTEAILRARSLASEAFLSVDPSAVSVLKSAGVMRIRDLLQILKPNLVLANRAEAIALAGVIGLENCFRELHTLAPLVVIKDGSRGAHISDGERRFNQPSIKAEVVDTTGAGDAFNGGWLAAELAGAGLRDRAALATRMAARCVGALGARSE